MARIAVAMSGGGHRAALFGLGALLYLVDSGKAREVTSVASVSGGSLTNGAVAQAVDLPSVDAAAFRRAVTPAGRRFGTKGTVWPPSSFTAAYLAVLALVGLVAIVGVWFLPWPVGLRVLAFAIGLLIFGVVASLRGLIVARAFAKTLFSPGGSPTRLSAIHTGVDHLICTAELHTGENVYFGGGFVCSYRFGWGEPGDLPLHVAVQCSAALPGVMPPRWLPTRRHGFVDGDGPGQNAGWMALVDGGVYDNMADQWGLGMRDRRRHWPQHAVAFRDCDELIIVNASAGLEWEPVWKTRLPLVGEIVALLKDKSILYDNGNAVRRELAVDRFQSGELRGALVHIPRSPLDTATKYADGSDEAAIRAKDVLTLLEPERARWEAVTSANAKASTGLWPMGVDRAADLLRHGYVLAMANLHVILGYPLLQVPGRAAFEELVR